MSTRRRGFESERIVADYLTSLGWEVAPPSHGAGGSDLLGIEGTVWEVKARNRLNLREAMTQAIDHKEYDDDLPIVVVRLSGEGPARVADWPAVVPLSVLARLLKAAGL